MCQATSPEKFWFSRYGVKGGQKWLFSRFSQNLDSRFGSLSKRRKISSFYIFVPTFESRQFFVLEIQCQMGVKMGQKCFIDIFIMHIKTSFCFPYLEIPMDFCNGDYQNQIVTRQIFSTYCTTIIRPPSVLNVHNVPHPLQVLSSFPLYLPSHEHLFS